MSQINTDSMDCTTEPTAEAHSDIHLLNQFNYPHVENNGLSLPDNISAWLNSLLRDDSSRV